MTISDTREPAQKLLQSAFQNSAILTCEIPTNQTRVFLTKRSLLKALKNPGARDQGHKEEVEIYGSVSYVILIHSSLASLKEFKEVQLANREQFLVNSFVTKPNMSNSTASMPPQDAIQRMEQLKHEYLSRENFHYALLEYWMTNSGLSLNKTIVWLLPISRTMENMKYSR